MRSGAFPPHLDGDVHRVPVIRHAVGEGLVGGPVDDPLRLFFGGSLSAVYPGIVVPVLQLPFPVVAHNRLADDGELRHAAVAHLEGDAEVGHAQRPSLAGRLRLDRQQSALVAGDITTLCRLFFLGELATVLPRVYPVGAAAEARAPRVPGTVAPGAAEDRRQDLFDEGLGRDRHESSGVRSMARHEAGLVAEGQHASFDITRVGEFTRLDGQRLGKALSNLQIPIWVVAVSAELARKLQDSEIMRENIILILFKPPALGGTSGTLGALERWCSEKTKAKETRKTNRLGRNRVSICASKQQSHPAQLSMRRGARLV